MICSKKKISYDKNSQARDPQDAGCVAFMYFILTRSSEKNIGSKMRVWYKILLKKSDDKELGDEQDTQNLKTKILLVLHTNTNILVIFLLYF